MGDSTRSKILLTVTSDKPTELDAREVQIHIHKFFRGKVKPIIANNTKVMLHWDGESLDTLYIRSVIPNEFSLVPNSCIFDPSKINIKNVVLPTLTKPSPPCSEEGASSSAETRLAQHDPNAATNSGVVSIEDETEEKRMSYAENVDDDAQLTSLEIVIKKRTKRFKKIVPKPPPITEVPPQVATSQPLTFSIASPFLGLGQRAPLAQPVYMQPVKMAPFNPVATMVPAYVSVTPNSFISSNTHNIRSRPPYSRSSDRSRSPVKKLPSETAYKLLDEARRTYYRRRFADQPEEEEPPEEGLDSDSA